MSCRVRGFTLIELMIAMALSLFVVGVVLAMFSAGSRTLRLIEATARQMENGRYALQLLGDDLGLAGYFGEFEPDTLTPPPAMPDPCSTVLADIRAAVPVQVQGYDDSDGGLGCLADVRPNTDVIVIRRVNTCAAGSTGCEAVTAGTTYFQASLCNAIGELGSANVEDYFSIDSDLAALTKHKKDCATNADLREMLVHIYFVANNLDADQGDGIPTLKRWELNNGTVSLVEGIEDLQIEYGIDADGDGAPDSYMADPDDCDTAAHPTCRIDNWRNVTAAKLNLLSRDLDASVGYSNTKTYALGLNKEGDINAIGPFNDAFRRHTYSTLVVAKNISGRRQQ